LAVVDGSAHMFCFLFCGWSVCLGLLFVLWLAVCSPGFCWFGFVIVWCVSYLFFFVCMCFFVFDVLLVFCLLSCVLGLGFGLRVSRLLCRVLLVCDASWPPSLMACAIFVSVCELLFLCVSSRFPLVVC